MNHPSGQCPVCNERLTNTDDIVICPECGAPYHRACYKQEGRCVYSHLHGEGFEYKTPQQIKAERAEKQMEAEHKASGSGGAMRCPRCGAANDTRNIFCESCGAPLHAPAPQNTRGPQQAAQPGGIWPPRAGYGPGGGAGAGQGAWADYAGELDGVPKKDWAAFIGSSAPVYLQRLEGLQRRGGVSFMFSAFFLGPFYFAYRKMWGWAALTLVLAVSTNIAVFLGNLVELGLPVVAGGADTLITVANVAYILSFVVQLLTGVFALQLFRMHAVKRLRALRGQHADDAAYREAIPRKGGVSVPGAVVAVVLTVIIFTVFLFALYGHLGDAMLRAVYAMYGVAV